MFLQLFHLWEGEWAIHQEKVWHWLMHSSCSSPRWRFRMQFVCHERHCALWTCVEDFKDGSLGTNSDSHAPLLSKGQWPLLTLRVFWNCHGKVKRRKCQSHQDSAKYVEVKWNNSPHYITFKLWNSNSFFAELGINWAEQFDEIHPKRIFSKQYR